MQPVLCFINATPVALKEYAPDILLWSWIHHHVKDAFQTKLEESFFLNILIKRKEICYARASKIKRMVL